MSKNVLTKAIALTCSWLVVCSWVVSAQVTTPAEFLGYELGDRFTRHHKVVDYAQTLAAESDRALWSDYGKTSEFRDLGLLIISSPENHDRMEDLRKSNLARAEGNGWACGANQV